MLSFGAPSPFSVWSPTGFWTFTCDFPYRAMFSSLAQFLRKTHPYLNPEMLRALGGLFVVGFSASSASSLHTV